MPRTPEAKKLPKSKARPQLHLVPKSLPPMPLTPTENLLQFNKAHTGLDIVRNANRCKWPVSPDDVRPMLFCDCERLDGRPYCAFHSIQARRYVK